MCLQQENQGRIRQQGNSLYDHWILQRLQRLCLPHVKRENTKSQEHSRRTVAQQELWRVEWC